MTRDEVILLIEGKLGPSDSEGKIDELLKLGVLTLETDPATQRLEEILKEHGFYDVRLDVLLRAARVKLVDA